MAAQDAIGGELDRASVGGDVAMTAAALAMGAYLPGDSKTRPAAVADRELARASVLLENADGATLETATAHTSCGNAYHRRSLWELELEHYQAAERVLPDDPGARVMLPAIRYSIAEAQLQLLIALRQHGSPAQLHRHAAEHSVGGDELLLLLPATRLEVARERAGLIVAQVAGMDWGEVSAGLRVTVSAGVAAGDPCEYDAVLAAADVVLYESKRHGCNVVHVSGSYS